MQPRLRAIDIQKQIGGTTLLNGVSLTAHPGEIHVLLGETGSGKSALIKCLAGCWRADAGRMELEGHQGFPRSPKEARARGIRALLQEPTLIPRLSVEENLSLGREGSRWGWLNRGCWRARINELLARFGAQGLDLAAPVATCSRSQRRLIELLRALLDQPRLLLLDAPTEGFSTVHAQSLHEVLIELQKSGVSILYTTKSADECRRWSDTCTVLRDGKSAGTGDIRPMAARDLFRLMTAREPADMYPRSNRERGSVVLSVQNFVFQDGSKGVSFTVRQGEILGLFGLAGSGKTRLFRNLFGLENPCSGEILIQGTDQTLGTPAERWRREMGFLPQAAHEATVLRNRSVAENLLITGLEAVSTRGIIRQHSERFMALDWMEHTDVRAISERQLAGDLSNGSQRCLAAGRLYYHQARLLLLDEPCQGIDLASRVQIYRRMDKAAAGGKGVLIGSSNAQELLALCDTIGVLRDGNLEALRPAREWTEEELRQSASS